MDMNNKLNIPHRYHMCTEKNVEPTESDESGSLHFEATPKKKDGSAPPVKGERKVCFDSRVRCLHFKEATITNSDDLWYSKKELASLRKKNKRLRRLAIMAGVTSFAGDDDTEEISFVGFCSEMDRREQSYTKEATACVLGEQEQQQEDYFDEVGSLSDFKLDQESILEFFSIYSTRAANIAHMKALQLSWHVESLGAEKTTVAEGTHRSCSQRSRSHQHSKDNSGHGPVRNASIRPADSLIARLTAPAAA
ncbi:unnamed protein product [Cylindrotheca closterium]|uniref:Uncharacterized protein n=1 Tax=Cylindrotheca closterium TaxID=2856 RepID=A0AAD2FPY5_9STRA|nr:unnamed protein product [Cylindrotheca closterium]